VTHCFFLTHRCLMLGKGDKCLSYSLVDEIVILPVICAGMTQVLHRFEDIMRAYSRVSNNQDEFFSVQMHSNICTPDEFSC